VYVWALGVVVATAAVMASIRWREDMHLFLIAVVAAGLGWYGYRARRHRRRGWPLRHAVGMGSSYIALLTGFYVDNGPFLPVWNRLPDFAFWVLPTAVGAPLIWLGVHRFTRGPSPGHVRGAAQG
jgi:hypothetical protein